MNEARRRYGHHVWIITPLSSTGDVVFHRRGAPYLTQCGRPMHSRPIHIDHARRFARPCHQCWRVDQTSFEIPIEAVA